VTSPLGLFAPLLGRGTYDRSPRHYAFVNINDPDTRVPRASVRCRSCHPAQYAIRLWVRPDTLGKLDITVNEIVSALQAADTP